MISALHIEQTNLCIKRVFNNSASFSTLEIVVQMATPAVYKVIKHSRQFATRWVVILHSPHQLHHHFALPIVLVHP
jgi:hypothetical protein